MAKNMHAFYESKNAIQQCDPTANVLDIVQCTVDCITSIIQHESFLNKIAQKF